MATYKVIQDIEAEDKIVGPLTLRQLIYAGIAALCGYLSFIALSKGASFLLVVFGPIMLFTGFFAFPWGRDQPTEVWALAKIRFFLKPRRRIWDQTGASDLVQITAPKRIEKVYTNQLSQTEVHSRLSALANTLDSRGWAVKNVNTNIYDPRRVMTAPDSDRLVNAANMPQEVSPIDVLPGDDILDEQNNPRAQKLEEMVTASSKSRRQQLIDQMRQPGRQPAPILPAPVGAGGDTATIQGPVLPQPPPPADYWFLQKPVDLPQTGGGNSTVTAPAAVADDTTITPQAVPAANPTPDEAALAEELKANRERAQQTPYYQHMKIIQPLGVQAAQARHAAQQPPVTPHPDAATMELANNNDLNISTIARIANKQDEHPDEVVISLHNHSS